MIYVAASYSAVINCPLGLTAHVHIIGHMYSEQRGFKAPINVTRVSDGFSHYAGVVSNILYLIFKHKYEMTSTAPSRM